MLLTTAEAEGEGLGVAFLCCLHLMCVFIFQLGFGNRVAAYWEHTVHYCKSVLFVTVSEKMMNDLSLNDVILFLFIVAVGGLELQISMTDKTTSTVSQGLPFNKFILLEEQTPYTSNSSNIRLRCCLEDNRHTNLHVP